MRLGQLATTKEQVIENEKKIFHALNMLKKEGCQITLKLISALTEIPRRQLYYYAQCREYVRFKAPVDRYHENYEATYNPHYQAIIEAGYSFEVRTGNNSKGMLYLIKDGIRLMGAPIKTGGDLSKAVGRKLPHARPGTSKDDALKEIRRWISSEAK